MEGGDVYGLSKEKGAVMQGCICSETMALAGIWQIILTDLCISLSLTTDNGALSCFMTAEKAIK